MKYIVVLDTELSELFVSGIVVLCCGHGVCCDEEGNGVHVKV